MGYGLGLGLIEGLRLGKEMVVDCLVNTESPRTGNVLPISAPLCLGSLERY